jgi:hypothetical protein
MMEEKKEDYNNIKFIQKALEFAQKPNVKKQKVHHDLENLIRENKEGIPQNIIQKNEYLMDADLARKIFGSYFSSYEKKKKEEEDKKKEETKEQKTQLYDLNISEKLKTVNNLLKKGVDNFVEQTDKAPPIKRETTVVILVTSFIMMITFIILGYMNILEVSIVWYILSGFTLLIPMFLYWKYRSDVIFVGKFSTPIMLTIGLSIMIYGMLFYVYIYLQKTPMFAIYGSYLNTVFAVISAFIVLFIFATAQATENIRSFTNTESHINTAGKKSVEIMKEYIRYSISLFGGIILVGISSWLILKVSTSNEFLTTFLSILFVLLLLLTVLYVIYRLTTFLPEPTGGFLIFSQVFKLIYHLFFAIPCFFFDVILNVKSTPTFVYKLLAGQIGFVALYILLPRFWKWLREKGHVVIQGDAVKLNVKKSYMNWSQLFKTGVEPTNINPPSFWEKIKNNFMKQEQTFMDYMKDHVNTPAQEFKYEYRLTFETFFHNIPPNTTHLGNQFVRVFSFGEKPSVWYKSNTQEFQFRTVEYKEREGRLRPKERILYTHKIPVQKWNLTEINYKNGTIDIFINQELVHTESGLVPYIENDEIYSGQKDGMNGGIRNIMYYNEIPK